MIVDSLTSTNVYCEKKKLITIPINSEINNDGTLRVDSNGNELVSMIDSGDTYIYRISKGNNILLYNERDFTMRYGNQGDIINMPINYDYGTKYLLHVEIVKGTRNSKNSFTVDTKNKDIFKVFLDCGKEIKSYSFLNGILTISGGDLYYLDDFSELSVYIYDNSSIDEIELEYYNYEKVWGEEVFNETYFENFNGIELNAFESLEVSQSKTQETIKRDFKSKGKIITNSISNTITLDTFNGSGYQDLVQYAKRDEFRLILINSPYGRVVLINNCTIDSGVSFIYEKEKNKKSFTIDCGNYIDIQLGQDKAYGVGEYGVGKYGSEIDIYNSRVIL